MPDRPADPPQPAGPETDPTPRRRPGPVPPVVPAAAAFAAGVAASPYLGVGLAAILLIAAATARAVCAGSPRRGVALGTLILASLGVGVLVGREGKDGSWADFVADGGGLVRVDGVVTSRPQVVLRERPFVREVDRLGRVEIAVGGSGPVRVLGDGPFDGIGIGDRVRVTGRLLPPRRVTNPGQRTWPGDGPAVAVGSPENVRLVRPGGSSLARFRAGLAARVSASFHRHLTERHAAVADALLLGRRDGITRELRDGLVGLGAVHLISISGLHLGLLAWAVRRLGRACGCGPVTQCWLPAAVVVAYAGLIDGRPPATRAAVAVCVWTFVALSGRATTVAATLAVAAVAILWVEPGAIGDIGAQLSFLAILGVTLPARAGLWGGRGIEETPPAWPVRAVRHVGQVFAAGCTAFAATAPLVALRIGIVAPAGPVAGLLLLPPVVLLLAVGFAWVAAAAVGLDEIPFVGAAFGGLFTASASLFELLMAAMGPLASSAVAVPVAGAAWTLAALTVVVATYWSATRLGPRRVVGLMVVAGGVAAVPHVVGVGPPGLRVTFLDVGHGGATLIERPDGRAVLFDCGSLGDGSRAARAVGDALRARGLAGLDAVVISHPDADHDNGLTAVLKRHGVSSVVTTRRFLRSAEPVSIGTRAAVATAGVPITFAAAGDELDFGAGVTARVLAPGEEESSAEDRREVADNETSLVLAVTYAGRTVVLTGDIEGEPLTEMLGRTGPLDCEVLAAPHHGSPNVETGPLLAAYSPRIVVVSAGSRLARETVEAAYGDAAPLWTQDGAVTVTVDPEGRVDVSRGP